MAQNLESELKNLRKTLAWMDLVLASLTEGVFVLDKSWKIIFTNDAVSQLTGQARIFTLGKNIWDIIPLTQADAGPKQTSIRNITALNGEYRLKQGKGEITVELTAAHLPYLNQAIVVLRDVSGAKQTADALQAQYRELEQAHAQAEAILESIGEGLIATDAYGRVINANTPALKMLGFTSKDLFGQWYPKVIEAKTADGAKIDIMNRPITRALETGKAVSENIHLVRKDKTLFPAAVTVSPILISGIPKGAIQVFHDITDELAIEEAKNEFVSLASHQLRTPLSTINWFTEMLLSGDAGQVTPDQKEYLDEIYNSNKRMVELINALLNVSRIELGTLAIEPVSLKLPEMAKSVLGELKPQLMQKKQRIVEIYAKDVPVIKADPKLVRIIFQNLLSNAVKYTPDGGQITVAVEMEPAPAGKKGKILIKVADTGYGIPESQKSKMFTKLFRADNVRSKDPTGTGLGLYLVKSIVENAGGKIWFESKEDKGTTFFVELPPTGMKKKQGVKSIIV